MAKDEKEIEAFYIRLKEQLEESTEWPSTYLYKFIVPTVEEKIEKIESIFEDNAACIKTKQSSNGKYTSVSVEVNMENPDAVIDKYKEVSVVEDVISL
ncbi:DUF493 family protein [Galbibacter sp. EGI 63066]|uniref:DUF493 family protein n=1 Tax=Galbibacter sp. EGI 63066 TaxID=2993559 RepID=UPI0022488D04|nr:DUF493 family protein [Galbibacter sp. EGI 63066]MCX2680905.1 DUF493 family protein [Galbibacter sp. EGI 63066]